MGDTRARDTSNSSTPCSTAERFKGFKNSSSRLPAMDYNSEKPSLAELKVAELLKEVRVEYPLHETVQGLLSALSSCFQQIPEHQVTSSLIPSFVEDLGVPAHKAKFTFKSPMHIEIFGSYAIQTMAKPIQTMDLAVEIPKSCFHEKDFLNHRYHAKRALYLAVLQTHLKKCTFVKGTKWKTLHQDARKPLLLVQLGNELKVDFKFDVCLVPVIGQDVFNISKLVPSRNNIKLSESEVGSGASPHYNTSILEDVDIQAHCLYLRDALARNDNSRDAVLLLKVWLQQRGFSNMSDSMNGFLISMFLAHLIYTGDRKITGNMNALQIFRVCIESLATGLLEKPMVLSKESSGRVKEELTGHFEYFDAIMMSNFESCNIASRLSKNAMTEIKDAACATIAVMKSTRDFGFDEIFMTAVDFSVKFDYHFRICMQDQPWKPPSFADEDKCRDVEKQVLRILSQGLCDRARLLRVYGRAPPLNWDLKKGMDIIRKLPIFVGVIISNIEAANRMVDVGPSADKVEEAGKFRSFWGEKSELRRFKDGKINETAVWECESIHRHLIIPKIVQHVLLRHLSLSIPFIHVSGGQLDHVLMEGDRDSSTSTPKLLLAFDVLSKRLRSLEDLPLKISSVQTLHPAFRHAAIFPPKVHTLADERLREGLLQNWVSSCIDPLEVMVQLEGSGRWPTNREAIEKTKLAFCLKIADSLCRAHGIKCVAAEESVDLLMHGFCFRLRLHYDRDPTLVHPTTENIPVAKALASLPDKASSRLLLDKDLSLRSLHSSMLGGLQGRYPAYGPTVRLAKRWIGSHLFSDVLREEAVELLVAFLFVKPAPYSPPSSRITGFLRFLLLLRNYDWAFSPLVVDINGDFTGKEYTFIMDEFGQTRKQELREDAALQRAVMFIAAPYDLKSQTWTASSPNKLLLKRVVAYAKTSSELLDKLIKGETPERWPSLFCTPLNLFDIILKVQPRKLAHPHRVLFPAEVKAAVKVSIKAPEDAFQPWLPASALRKGVDVEKQLLLGFDPTLCFIEDIKGKFGDLFNYWYDHIGSRAICLSWKSSSEEAMKKRKRAEDCEDIMIELGRLGAGFIESIHVVDHR
ncbi:hypothetical protein GOP47_0000309 [Adiantum capillus-veneris]|uniref:Nucleolar protein 6 n=1 Tax=Adiantum capillus-veneris TaxID=13818 RepID=A0A9D4VDQ1_ADICA|nr:hypothetical protein GOP47_0000309 [Adiantum capillus-veneris]